MIANSTIFKRLFLFSILLMSFSGITIRIYAQGAVTIGWPLTSNLSATVGGAAAATVTANSATLTTGTGNMFTATTPYVFGASGLTGTAISGKASTTCNASYNSVGSSSPITPYMEFSLAPVSGYNLTLNSFSFTVTGANVASSTNIAVGYSLDGGQNFYGFDAPTVNTSATGTVANISPTGSVFTSSTGSAAKFTFALGSKFIKSDSSMILRIVVWRNNGSNSSNTAITIGSLSLTGTTTAVPAITLSKGALTAFAASPTNTSSPKSFTVSGINLISTVELAAPASFEISRSEGSGFGSSISLTGASGTLAATTIYARLKSGLTVGNTYNESISVTSSSAVSKNVTLNGGVYNNVYYSTSSDISSPSSWNTLANGSGSSPSDFSAANTAYFNMNTGSTLNSNLIIDPLIGSRLLIGDGITPVTFTIPSTFNYSGYLDVMGSSRLIVQNATLTDLLLGTIDSLSTVQFDGSSLQVITTNSARSNVNFGNFEITNTSGVRLGTTTTIKSSCLVKSGAKLIFGLSNSAISLGGTGNFITESGSSLTITSSSGIVLNSTTTGNIRNSGTRTINSGTNILYTTNSTTPALGSGFPSIIGDLTIDLTSGNATTLSLSTDLTVNNFTLTTGKISVTGSAKTLSVYGNLTVQAAGILDAIGGASGGVINVYSNATNPGNVVNNGIITGTNNSGTPSSFGFRGTNGSQTYSGNASGVTGASNIVGGSGYTDLGTTVTVTGNGTGAIATAIITAGVITGISITNGGSGYTSAGFSITGDGIGASANALLEGNTFGTASTPFEKITVRNANGITISSTANQMFITRLNAFSGTINNANKFTIGSGTAAPTIQRGYAVTETTGIISGIPSLNTTAGNVNLVYALAPSQMTEGPEVPASRAIGSITMQNTNGLIVSDNLTISGTVTLTSGVITVANNKTINFTATATVPTPAFAATSYINGTVSRVLNSTISTPLSFPIGNTSGFRGVILTVTQDANTSTTYTVQLKPGNPSTRNLPITINAVSNIKYYTITKGTGANVTNASVKITYGTEDGISDENNLRLVKDNGAGNWIDIGGVGSAAGGGEITSSVNFTSFSDFALANAIGGGNTLLPVKITHFSVKQNNNINELLWQTASESNTSHFEVMRSNDGINFKALGTVVAAGNSSSLKDYNFNDNNPFVGKSFYYINTLDVDGRSTKSQVVMVQSSSLENFKLIANPIKNFNLQYQVNGASKGVYQLSILTIEGKQLQQEKLQFAGGSQTFSIPLNSMLKPGIYIMRISNNNGFKSKTFLVQ